MIRIESMLSARLFLSPQRLGRRLYFISNLSGRLSLYAMDWGGSVPEPLLPPEIALQNPKLMPGKPFHLLPDLGQILVMIDQDGDENYQPMLIPLAGGYPEPAFGAALANYRVHLAKCDSGYGLAYLVAESRSESMIECFRGDLRAHSLELMGKSRWGVVADGVSHDHTRAILSTGYTTGDNVLHLWRRGAGEAQVLYGTPLE